MSMQDAGQEQLILDMVDRFLEKEVKPFAWQLEHDDEYPAEIVEKMKEMEEIFAGFLNEIHLPADFCCNIGAHNK